MGLIQPLDMQSAEGEIKEAFNFYMEALGSIPTPMALAANSPDVFKIKMKSMQYFMNHPTLGFALLSSIRYIVAHTYNYQFCVNLNRQFLEKQGLTPEDMEKIIEDPESAPLDDKDRAMVAFVAKSVKSPDAASQEDMDRLHKMGWTDRDVLDAMEHAGSMISLSVLMKTFKLDVTC